MDSLGFQRLLLTERILFYIRLSATLSGQRRNGTPCIPQRHTPAILKLLNSGNDYIIGGVLGTTETVIVVAIVWFIVVTIRWADIVRIIVPRPTPQTSDL